MKIYVLELTGGNYYVGITNNADKRIAQHFNGEGSAWTKRHKPVKVVAIQDTSNPKEDEKQLTMELMVIFGWQKVRGAGWTACDMKKAPQFIQEIRRMENLAYQTEQLLTPKPMKKSTKKEEKKGCLGFILSFVVITVIASFYVATN